MNDGNKKQSWDFWTWLVFCFFTIGPAIVGTYLFAKVKDWKVILFFSMQILFVIALAIFLKKMRPVVPKSSSSMICLKKTVRKNVIIGAIFVVAMAVGMYLNRHRLVPFIYADKDKGLTKEVYIKNGFRKSRFYVKDKKGIREFASSTLNARLVGAKIALSPDEKRVAVLYCYVDNPEIYIIDIANDKPKRLFHDVKSLFKIREKIKPPLKFFDYKYACKSIDWENNDTIRFGKIRSWGKWDSQKRAHKMITRYYLLDIASDNSGHNLRVGDEEVKYVKFPRGFF